MLNQMANVNKRYKKKKHEQSKKSMEIKWKRQ